MVFFGVGLQCCTLLHGAEEIAGCDYHLQPEPVRASITDYEGVRIEKGVRIHRYGTDRQFCRLEPMFLEKEIMKKGKVERGWIGIAVQNINYGIPEYPIFRFSKGLLIVDVIEGSPASISGLKKDDILISANGVSLKSKSHLRNLAATSPIGESINFRILRKGNYLDIPVNIAKLPDNVNIFDVRR